MALLVAIGLLILGVGLLYAGAELLVRSAETLGLRMGMTPVVVGLTIVAFATSAPELIGSLVAAWDGSPDLAIGNVIGSNIANIGLVLGIAALARPMLVERSSLAWDTTFALFLTAVLVAFLMNEQPASINRMEGAALFVGIIVYTGWRVSRARGRSNGPPDGADAEEEFSFATWLVVVLLIASVGILSGGAYAFVKGGQQLAVLLGVPERIIGLTVMALGTSLPEVATVVVAAKKGQSSIVFGNIIGSNIFNILSVVGTTAVFFPLTNLDVGMVDIAMFVGSALIVTAIVLGIRSVGWRVGLALTSAYVAYVAILYL